MLLNAVDTFFNSLQENSKILKILSVKEYISFKVIAI